MAPTFNRRRKQAHSAGRDRGRWQLTTRRPGLEETLSAGPWDLVAVAVHVAPVVQRVAGGKGTRATSGAGRDSFPAGLPVAPGASQGGQSGCWCGCRGCSWMGFGTQGRSDREDVRTQRGLLMRGRRPAVGPAGGGGRPRRGHV